jgi:signal transduction histidine kinase
VDPQELSIQTPNLRMKLRALGASFLRWRVGVPVLALIALIGCSGFLLLADIARSQDSNYEESTTGYVRQALDGLIYSNTKIATEYSIWDDAYQNVTLKFDPEWLTSNFYSTNSSSVSVIRPTEGLRYLYVKPELESRRPALEAFLKDLSVVRKERSRGASMNTYVHAGWSGFKIIDGNLASVAIQFLQPEPGSNVKPRDMSLPVDFTVVITFVDATALDALARTFSLDNLQLNVGTQPPTGESDRVNFEIKGHELETLGWVSWTNLKPGTDAFAKRLLPIVLMLFLVGVLTIYVTQQIVAKQMLLTEQARLAAEDASVAKSTFLDSVSHELRTPLNAIIGFSDVIEEECAMAGNHVTAKDAKKINNSAHHLLGLINDLLDHSKIEAGKMDMCPILTDIEPVITSVAETLEHLVAKNGSELIVRCDPLIGDAIIDDMRLKQCLLNLVSNAAKFTIDGKVTLAARPVELEGVPFIRMSVKDTGIGMSEETLERLFNPFTQADKDTAKKFGGTGLGLVITRKLAEAMGGSITVESVVGEGSTFTLLIPRGKNWDRDQSLPDHAQRHVA